MRIAPLFLNLFLFLCSICMISNIQAQTSSQLYTSANRDFENGKFEDAETKYRDILDKGLGSEDLYYNLGSTLYRLDRPGEAVLWYRRALVLDPGLSESRQSLTFIQNKTGFLEFAESDFAKFIRAVSSPAWNWILWTSFWIFVIGLSTAILISQARRFRPLLYTFSSFALVISFLAFQAHRYRKKHLAVENFATVVSSDASAQTSPVIDSEAVIELPPGSEVRITRKSGPWIYADVPGDLRGWIRSEDVENVWPPSK